MMQRFWHESELSQPLIFEKEYFSHRFRIRAFAGAFHILIINGTNQGRWR
jgi:hypothetical protein